MSTITSLSFQNGKYTIGCVQEGKEYTVIGELIFLGNENYTSDEFLKVLEDKQFIGKDITNNAHWNDKEEYIILLPKLYQHLPEDRLLLLGTFRYYIMDHLQDTGDFYFKVLSDNKELDGEDFLYSLLEYIED